ncbi:dystrobrevin beta-like isoform X4 [Oratosquilla oratoria]|uniref:dystrobrevin beta-like isoform X4 n=1 Tax=Oratosquilla oratoria TaxID=337810 RepID=UPI003F76A5AD
MLRGTGEGPIVIYPHKMFVSRRKSHPDVVRSAPTATTTSPFISTPAVVKTKKRRASSGFMNSEVMESTNEDLYSGSAGGGGGVSANLSAGNDLRHLMMEMRQGNYDSIRFASYRTAAKLRFVQKKTNMHFVDIWNIIEAFRENGLNTLEPYTEVKVSRLETLISSLYHALNKRLPAGQHIMIDFSTSVLLNWLLSAYDVDDTGKMRVFSIKVALATLCSSKPLDKLRYIFSQISDSNGHLSLNRFSEYLKEVLALPAAVFESPSFTYSENLVDHIFDGVSKINVNDFLDVVLGNPGPDCLSWLPLLHRLAAAESDTVWAVDLIDDDFVDEFVHQTMCDGCKRENFSGLRYKCQRCYNYQMCQECFWLGNTSPPHCLEHEVKEYTAFSPTKQISHSLRKSFRCVPEKPPGQIPKYPEEPEKPLNLSHIVPPSPMPSHNGFGGEAGNSFDMGSLDSRSSGRSRGTSMPDWSQLDEEHRLIAHYAARLAQEGKQNGQGISDPGAAFDASRAQRELIQTLEAKNKEIMREINRLSRHQQERGDGTNNPVLVAELRALRTHKEELETHLSTLQDSRRQLMVQLEGLMKMLKNHQASPKSTPNSSPRSTKSPPLSTTATIGSTITISNGGSNTGNGTVPSTSRSAPPTPSHGSVLSSNDTLQSRGDPMSSAISSDESSSHHTPGRASALSIVLPHETSPPAFSTLSTGVQYSPDSSPTNTMGSGGRCIRNDLLEAADSVTNAMSSLVRELNSESSDDDNPHLTKPLPERGYTGDGMPDRMWRSAPESRSRQENDFLAQIHARNPSYSERMSQSEVVRRGSGSRLSSVGDDDDSSYAKTDDDGTEWEETRRRWINR